MPAVKRDHLRGFDFRHDAPALGRAKTARVVIPEGPVPQRGFPTWYVLHGFGGNRLSWLGDPQPLGCIGAILVFPESGRRWFLNDASGHRYEDYVVHDLVPEIDRALPTDGDLRIVGGFSMGGAAAIFLALRYPEVFRCAFSYAGAFYASRREGDPYANFREDGACMMPTQKQHERVWGPPGSPVRQRYDPDRVIADACTARSTPAMSLEVGVDDYPRIVEMNRLMHRTLHAAGLEHSYLERRGAHTWPDAKLTARRAMAFFSAG